MELGGRAWRGESLSSVAWASIEHLMCIGGELEHHKALPSPAKKTEQCGVLYSPARGIYRHHIGLDSWLELGLKDTLWYRFMPRIGAEGGFSFGSCHEPGQISCLYIPFTAAEHSVFFWPVRGGHLGALAHLL